MDRMATRTLTALSAFLLLIALSAPAVQAQQANLVVDADGQAATGTVDCDASGTTDVFDTVEAAVAEANADTDQDDIYICPGTYGPDEDVVIESSIDIQGAGTDQVTVQATPQGAEKTAFRIVDGAGLSDITIKDFRIVQTSSSQSNAATLFVGADADGVEISGLSIQRGGSLANTASAIRIDGTNVEVSGCDISGGPIGFYGDPAHNYTIENNTLRGAGNESIWIVDGNEISVTNNTVEATSDGEAGDDYSAIAVYNPTTSLTLQGNDVREITRTPVVLGAGIPVIDPDTGSPVSLTTVTELQDIVLANNTLGPITYVSESDASTLREEAGNASETASNVFGLRRTITSAAPGGGGSDVYDISALDLASMTDEDVIWLSDGATYNETITVSSNLGFASTGESTVDAIDVEDGQILATPSGSIRVGSSLTVGLNSEIDGTPIVLGGQANLTDNGLAAGEIKATRTVEADDQTENFGNIGLSLTATGTAPGEVTVTRTDGDPVTEGDGSISRVYDVEAATSTGLTVDVGLEYDDGTDGDDELTTSSVSDEASLAIFRSTDDGATWSELGSTSQDTGANVFTALELSDLSLFTLAEAGGVLPVEFAGVTARADGRDAVLSWTTASESNNTGFRVQQKTERGFETVAFVEGQGTTSGETTYRHRVADLSFGEHVFRLAQVDTDGTTSLSGEVPVDIQMDEAYTVSQVAPMPISGQGRIDVAVNESQTVTVEVFDMLGRQMMTLHDGEMRSQQTRTLSIPADRLSSGHYFVRVRGEGFQVTRRMVIVQ